MYIGRDNIKVQVKLLNSGSLFATATVILFGCCELHGWKIMQSAKMHPRFGEQVWIQGPSYKTTSGWKEIVFINDRDTWDLVQEMIFDGYHMARSKKEGFTDINELTNSTNEEVNLDEIPL